MEANFAIVSIGNDLPNNFQLELEMQGMARRAKETTARRGLAEQTTT
jgi:hypothetical protein